MVQRIDERKDTAQRDEAIGGFQSDDAAVRRRNADGAARVCAQSGISELRTDRRRRSAGRPARNAVERPRIAHRAEVAGGRCAAHRKLVQVGLPDDDGPGRAHPLHHKGVLRGHIVV